MINYSKKALRGLVFLFRPYNDIDIMVEDVSCRNMYETLFERIADGRFRIVRIFQLGGRDEVISECAKHAGDTRALYLIDGDFDVLLGKKIVMPNLYQLNVYCSENLIVTGKSLTEVAFECETNKSRDEIAKLIDFAYVEQQLKQLEQLLVVYIVLKILGSDIPSSSFNVTEALDHVCNPVSINNAKIQKRIDRIVDELAKNHSAESVVEAIKQAEGIVRSHPNSSLRLISGKTHIIPFIFHYLHKRVGFAGNLDQLKVRLARHCELDVDPELVQALHACSRSA